MDSYGWKIKTWKLSEKADRDKWIEKWQHKYQMREIFINNEYGIEYRLLIHR